MRRRPTTFRPTAEGLDAKILLSNHTQIRYPPNAIVTNVQFTPADLRAYAKAYLSHRGQGNYNPLYDFHGSGTITQLDATPILRSLRNVTPYKPFNLVMSLAPGESAANPHPHNSGGVTYRNTVTIVGHTVPNAVIFTDDTDATGGQSSGTYKFRGVALTSDANGYFSETVKLGVGINGTFDYLVRDPYGRQTIRAFPVLKIDTPFNQGSPRKT